MDCHRWFLQFLWQFWTALVPISTSMIFKTRKENKTRSCPREKEGDLIWCSSWKQEPGQFSKLHQIWVSVIEYLFEEKVPFQNKPYIFKTNTVCYCFDHHRYSLLPHLHIYVYYKELQEKKQNFTVFLALRELGYRADLKSHVQNSNTQEIRKCGAFSCLKSESLLSTQEIVPST